jgi:hypothetical protein
MQNLKRRFSSGQYAMRSTIMEHTLAVSESGTHPVAVARAGEASPAQEVTLVVYGWHNVQPGTLSWVFPSFDAAMKAASALRNATQWAIMGGSDASGTILAERSA